MAIIVSPTLAVTPNVTTVSSISLATSAAGLEALQKANSAGSYANSSFELSNTISSYANSGFAVANSGSSYANAAFRHANSAHIHANSSFGLANTISSYANSAFTNANSSYEQANASFRHANAAFGLANTISSYGNSAFAVSNSGSSYANSAFRHANSSFASSNTIASYANSGFAVANSGSSYANAAFRHANSSFSLANTIASYGNSAFAVANSSSNYANGAFALANTKFNSSGGTISGNVVVTGNITPTTDVTYYLGSNTNRWHTLFVGPGSINIDNVVIGNTSGTLQISGASDLSLTSSNFGSLNQISNTTNLAYSTANSAASYANAAFANANSSYEQANASFRHANSAFIYGNTAFGLSNTVSSYANSSFFVSNSAASYANSAFVNANSSYEQANASFRHANASFVHANNAFVRANNSVNANTGGTITGDLIISGNLTVTGQTSYVNTQTVLIADNIITLNAAINQAAAPALNAGIEIDRGSSANVYILWNEATDSWQFTNDGSSYENLGGGSSGEYANGAFRHANSAFTHANSSFSLANTISSYANSAFIRANNSINANTGGVITGNLTVTANIVVGNSIIANSNTITLGSNTTGTLISNAVTLTTGTTVTNGLALLNQVLGKLVPPAPPTFPGSSGSITIKNLETFRMTNFTQTDNTPSARNVAGGTSVTTIRRAASYQTSNVSVVGPGDSGTLTTYKNGSSSGSKVLTTGDNSGTYSDLIILNDVDYGTITGAAQGFWESINANSAGTVSAGWNEVYMNHSSGSPTSTAYWYYDNGAPGAPQFTNLSCNVTIASIVYANSSTVPHYANPTAFNVGFAINRLSGDVYPTTDTFITGTSGGAFNTPSSVTYATAGVTTPLARNLYVSSGNTVVNTSATIISGFGSSSTGPSISSNNSYQSTTQAFTTPLNATVLYKTGTASSNTRIEEANVFFGSTVGTGSGLAYRIINPGSTDNPTYSASASAFDSTSSTLQTYDATVVAAVLKHDQTNYSTGYLPVGPNLSSSRSGPQYFTFKFIRTSVSKFDIQFTGNTAGVWIALPGSTIDSTSSINGWLDMTTAYAGSGIPGVNSPGNGSNGCSLGGTITANTSVTSHRKTCTFGTVSSSDTATNEIYVRFKLLSGQTITALSLQAPSN